jgi:hypothetical protein
LQKFASAAQKTLFKTGLDFKRDGAEKNGQVYYGIARKIRSTLNETVRKKTAKFIRRSREKCGRFSREGAEKRKSLLGDRAENAVDFREKVRKSGKVYHEIVRKSGCFLRDGAEKRKSLS